MWSCIEAGTYPDFWSGGGGGPSPKVTKLTDAPRAVVHVRGEPELRRNYL